MENNDILEVKIKKSEVSWVVWIVPLLALIVGGWMIYKYYSSMGPLISITFKNSGGLEPKQSYVKFREVKVGVVEKIEILKDKEGVIVYARMNKDVEPFLNENAKFWIVKPQIGLGKVQGLDALMSGAYIQMQSRLGSQERRFFVGLEEPPLDVEPSKGHTYLLKATQSYELEPGAPVYYKQMKVGRVEKVELGRDGEEVDIYIFVKKPYDRFVNASTKFWNLRGIDLTFSGDGLRVDMGSVSQILVGGVEFETKELFEQAKKGSEEAFYLYPSKKEALQKKLGYPKERYAEFLMNFDGGTGYLNIEAPVKFEGYKVGYVKDIYSYFDPSSTRIESQVLVSMDLSAFDKNGSIAGLEEAVKKGLKARLASANILSRSLYVELVFDKKPAKLRNLGTLYTFPTLSYRKNDIAALIEDILKKIEQLPLRETLKSFGDLAKVNTQPLKRALDRTGSTLAELERLLKKSNDQELPKKIAQDLVELQKTLQEYKDLARGYAKDSLFGAQLSETLKDIDEASRSLQKLLIKLDKKPNALIFGE